MHKQVHMRAGTPDHPITITPASGRVRVTFAGHVVADSDQALLLTEGSYAPVFYLPPEHVDFAALERGATSGRLRPSPPLRDISPSTRTASTASRSCPVDGTCDGAYDGI